MKKRLLSLLLAAACLMPLSGCDWGEEPEETYDTLSQYYQQSDSTKQDTRLTTFGLPYLQGETWDPITCADGAQQTLGALLYESLYTLGTDFLPRPCLAESASYDAESYALTVTVRSGVTFSDGSALTAWDVVAALRRAKESVRYGQRLAEMDSVSYLGESPSASISPATTRNSPPDWTSPSSRAAPRRTRYRWAAAPTAMPRTRAACIWPGERTGGRIRPCRWSASS